jgi:crossover junction endodeoxyribonuclease RusA
MTARIGFTVIGLPAPQGSKRHVGRGILIESSKNVKPWREAVKVAAYKHRTDLQLAPLAGPLSVTVTFYLPRPKSAPKSRTTPDRRPDLDKLLRSTFDALGEAGIWGDDAQVIEVTAAKAYAGAPNQLDVPGADITVRVWDEQPTAVTA